MNNLQVKVLPGNHCSITADISPGNTIENIGMEVELSAAYISGNVTKDGALVADATVYLIDETAAKLVGKTTTDENGEYKFSHIHYEHTYHLAVSWIDELDNMYNAKSKPFIAPIV